MLWNLTVLVYFARCNNGLIKIGATASPVRRRKQLYNVKPRFLFGFIVSGGFNGYHVEAAFHRHFKHLQHPVNYDYFRMGESELSEAKNLQIIAQRNPEYYGMAECTCHPWHHPYAGTRAKRAKLKLELVPLAFIRPKVHVSTVPLTQPAEVANS